MGDLVVVGILPDKLRVFEPLPVIPGSAWEDCCWIPLERRWFGKLSVRAGHVLFDGLKAKTFGDLFGLDAQTVYNAKNCGVQTCEEILDVRDEMFALGPKKFEEDLAAEKACETTNLPRGEVAGLSTRTRHFLKKSGITTYAQLFALQPQDVLKTKGAGAKTVKELADFAKRMGKEEAKPIVTKIEPVDPSGFGSLPEFVLGAADAKTRDSIVGNREVVFRDCLALGKTDAKLTLEVVGGKLNLTRERVRQIGVKIVGWLFDNGRAERYRSFADEVVEIFRAEEWIICAETLLARIDTRFGWSGSSLVNVVELMGYLGHRIEDAGGGRCACDFDDHLGSGYRAFLDYVNSYSGVLSGYSLEGVRTAEGLDGLTEKAYAAFVSRGMTHRMRRKTKAKRVIAARWQADIKPLRARQYFAHVFDLDAGPVKKGYNKGTLRKDAIMSVLMKAGPTGLEMGEILERCKSSAPTLDWSLNNIRAAANIGSDLDGEGTRIIGYERGAASGEKTRYTLNLFFRDEGTTAVLQKAGAELRAYMEESGFGIVSIWKVWLKYRKDLPVDLPKLGFYMMMREVGAAGLNYREYPRVAHPEVEYCEAAYHWELYQYFNLAGHPEATYRQIFDFLVECLCIDPVLANACVIPMMRLDFGKGGWTSGVCTIPMPKRKTDGFPNVLLENCNIDPELSFSLPRHRGLHITSADLDSNGRARTVLAYVRMFFYNLQESGYCFSSDEWMELGDAGWCAENFGIHNPVVVPVSVSREMPSQCYWTVPFDFGGTEGWVCDAWNAKRKEKFDVWAMRIAAKAGLEFEPYAV